MTGNSFGKSLVLTTFGESHGPAVGGVLDGYPPNLVIDEDMIQAELDRRRPGYGIWSTSRNEPDKVEFLSGIFECRSTGAPIAFLVRNSDARPQDYDHLVNVFRPSHADFVYHGKYGIRDHRGGGRSSARETVSRVIGGALAKIFLATRGISVESCITAIGPFTFDESNGSVKNSLGEPGKTGIPGSADRFARNHREDGETGIPESQPDTDTGSGASPGKYDPSGPDRMLQDPEVIRYLTMLKAEGDTTGGIITCGIRGVPVGLGEPVFDKLQADLARAMLSINAVKGFEFGSGFAAASMKGSEHNDPFVLRDEKIAVDDRHSGGIQGGISNGQAIRFRVAFKPASTLLMTRETLDMNGNPVQLEGRGRHDVCVVPRALPVVEAMAALVIADHLLRFDAMRIVTRDT
jgi:chorismate synthase